MNRRPRRRVTSRHLGRSLATLFGNLPSVEIAELAASQPLVGLARARSLVDAFRLGTRELLYLQLEVAYAASVTLMKRPRFTERLRLILHAPAVGPEPIDTLRLAVRYVLGADATGTARYAVACRRAKALDLALHDGVQVGGLRDYIERNGGVEELQRLAVSVAPPSRPVRAPRRADERGESAQPQYRAGTAVARVSAGPMTDEMVGRLLEPEPHSERGNLEIAFAALRPRMFKMADDEQVAITVRCVVDTTGKWFEAVAVSPR